jgi:hypothetical protein
MRTKVECIHQATECFVDLTVDPIDGLTVEHSSTHSGLVADHDYQKAALSQLRKCFMSKWKDFEIIR